MRGGPIRKCLMIHKLNEFQQIYLMALFNDRLMHAVINYNFQIGSSHFFRNSILGFWYSKNLSYQLFNTDMQKEEI